MTGKRFDIDDSDIVVDDLQTGESYIFDDYHSCENCCILLNELAEENEQLRHDATILIQSNQDYRKENERLKKEVEELKQAVIHAAFDKR